MESRELRVRSRVDHEERKRQVAEVVWRTAANEGIGAVKVAYLASQLGASTTIITREFSSRDEMLRFAFRQRTRQWRALGEGIMQSGLPPRERLRLLLLHECPLDEQGFQDVRIWLAAVASPGDYVSAHPLMAQHNAWIRGLLTAVLSELGIGLETVSFLLMFVWGVSVVAVEEPEAWPPSKVEGAVDEVLRLLGLDEPGDA